MVAAIILAAGRSSRMGRSKALLAAGDGQEPFVVRIVGALRDGGVAEVVVVGRPHDDQLLSVVGQAARLVVNEHADDGGQLSSLLTGLDACDDGAIAGVLVTPVDCPRLLPQTVASLLEAFEAAPGSIVRAVHHGRHGHPVIFPRVLFPELRSADPSRGAKAVLRAHDAAILDVEVPDPAVTDDIDTPEEYARIFGSS